MNYAQRSLDNIRMYGWTKNAMIERNHKGQLIGVCLRGAASLISLKQCSGGTYEVWTTDEPYLPEKYFEDMAVIALIIREQYSDLMLRVFDENWLGRPVLMTVSQFTQEMFEDIRLVALFNDAPAIRLDDVERVLEKASLEIENNE
jgi:hypothetical protein